MVHDPRNRSKGAPEPTFFGIRGVGSTMNRSVLPSGQLRGLLYATLLSAAAASAVHAETRAMVVLPAITGRASGEHHVGKVIWADLVTPDVDGAKRLYGGLFGWTFRDVPVDPNYTLVLMNDEPMAGIYFPQK
jgi:hypothetical protein